MLLILVYAIQKINDTGFGMVSENVVAGFAPLIWGIVGIAEFILSELLYGWKSTQKMTNELRQREKEEKAERKRRLAFPGKYTKLFYQIIWKNFLYNWKDYMMFILCGVMVSSITFAGFGIYNMMSGIHSDEIFLIGQGLGSILVKAMIPIGLFSVFLIVFILVFYLKNRIASYSVFVTLGIRRNMLFFCIGMELVISCICFIFIGFIIGNGIVFLFRYFLCRSLKLDAVLLAVAPVIYLKAMGVLLLIYLVAFMAARGVFDGLNISSAHMRKVKEERMPKKFLKILTYVGIFLVTITVYQYSQLKNYEYIYILLTFFVGLFLLIWYGGSWYLRRAKKHPGYLRKMLERSQLYHKSRTSAWYMYVLSVIHVFASFYFTFQIVSVVTAEDPDVLYPYDYMCITYEEDDTFFEELKEQYDVQIESYPMVRVSTADQTPAKDTYLESDPAQGQHIGIAESTYHALKKRLDESYQSRNLNLDDEGNSVYIVHQQDKSIQAQPTDWYGSRKKPYLHIGQPILSLNRLQVEQSFPRRDIAGEEIGSVTGCFRQGLLENLIVFSDTYFEEAQEMWKYTSIINGEEITTEEDRIPDVTIRQGATRLVLICAKQEDLASIDSKLAAFREKHIEDEKYDSEVHCYDAKNEAVDNLMTERAMKVIVNGFAMVILLVAGIFLICVKVFSDSEEQKKRAVFLECMGMRKRERNTLLKKEISRFYKIPCMIGIVSSIAFTLAVFHARMYTAVDMWHYTGCAAIIWIVYLLLYGAVILYLERVTTRACR